MPGARTREETMPRCPSLRRASRPLLGAALVLPALLALPAAGCAERLGRKVAEGATKGLREQSSDDPSEQPTRLAAERAVAGAVGALYAPEQRERLRLVVSEAVAEAVASALRTATGPEAPAAPTVPRDARGPAEVLVARLAAAATEDALRQVAADLGSRGALTARLSETGAAFSAGAVRSAVDELLPGCTGADAAACRQRRLEELTRGAATSFTAGVRDSIGWPLLLAALALGVLAGSFGHWLWSLHLRTRTNTKQLQVT
jgi:hypothetical protein